MKKLFAFLTIVAMMSLGSASYTYAQNEGQAKGTAQLDSTAMNDSAVEQAVVPPSTLKPETQEPKDF